MLCPEELKAFQSKIHIVKDNFNTGMFEGKYRVSHLRKDRLLIAFFDLKP